MIITNLDRNPLERWATLAVIGRLIATIFPLIAVCIILSRVNAQGEQAIAYSDSAVEFCNKISGFDKNIDAGRLVAPQVEKLVFRDSVTPFLGKYSLGNVVWKVSYANVHLAMTGTKVADSSKNRDFEVFIDSASGYLLKVLCTNGILDTVSEPILSAEMAESQLRNTREQYVGFPNDVPQTDFLSALNACPNSPLLAKQITGQYVLLRYGEREPHPVWVITLVGIPPIEPIGKGGEWIPIYQRNRIRQVVDSETGKVLYTSTIPGMALKPEDRERLFPDN